MVDIGASAVDRSLMMQAEPFKSLISDLKRAKNTISISSALVAALSLTSASRMDVLKMPRLFTGVAELSCLSNDVHVAAIRLALATVLQIGRKQPSTVLINSMMTMGARGERARGLAIW